MLVWTFLPSLSSLLFSFALEYGIRKVQGNKERLKLTGTHHLLIHLGDVNVLGDNILVVTIKIHIETLRLVRWLV
jgi:hypothetical protein